ncbi:hypothetical protein [Streptomyces misionensis]|uniref:hypothetical protein n=1 Tax=Streptomyces misionensis TaxID=67331 RepID=UPI0036CDB84E
MHAMRYEMTLPADHDPGAVLAVTAVEPHRWELVHFSPREHAAPEPEGGLFRAPHPSAPGRDLLPRGRQW